MNTFHAIPDRGHLLTEKRNSASADLDALSVEQTLRLINEQDAEVTGVVGAAIPAITPLVEAVVARLRNGGRLVYFGAGTSGRLGVLDASECPPTFHCDPGMVVGIIAGGDKSLRRSSEGAEDDPAGVAEEWKHLDIGATDFVIGIAAGGTTPYVLGGLRLAKKRGAATALVCCVSLALTPSSEVIGTNADERLADYIVELPVGPEVLTGSTRMKAGTATKVVLNMISTTVMVQLGKAWGNLMVDLRATNAKLRDRAARIICSQCDLSRGDALKLLDCAGGKVKVALVMASRGLPPKEAQQLLAQHGGQLRPILGPPK